MRDADMNRKHKFFAQPHFIESAVTTVFGNADRVIEAFLL